MQSRITLHLDLWEIIREVHTFTNRKNPSSFIEEKERALTVHSPKKPLKTAKTNDTLSLLCSIYKQTLFSDRFTQTTNILPRILARNPHLDSTVTKQSHATNATYPIVSDRFTASEILSFLLNVHGIRLSLRQLRRILKNRGCTRREQSTDNPLTCVSLYGLSNKNSKEVATPSAKKSLKVAKKVPKKVVKKSLKW